MDKDVNLKSLSSLAASLVKQKSNSQRQWRTILQTYPDNSAVLRQFGSFLEEVDANAEDSQMLYQRADVLEEARMVQHGGDQMRQSAFKSPLSQSPNEQQQHPATESTSNENVQRSTSSALDDDIQIVIIMCTICTCNSLQSRKGSYRERT